MACKECERLKGQVAAVWEFLNSLHEYVGNVASSNARGTGDEAFHKYMVLSEIQKQFFNPWPPRGLDSVEVVRVKVEGVTDWSKNLLEEEGVDYTMIEARAAGDPRINPGDTLLLVRLKEGE